MIGRKIIIQFIGVSLASFLGFLSLSLSARFFGAETLGEINYYLGILGIMLLFSDFGFSRAHVRFVADKKGIKEKVTVFLAVKLLLLSLFLVSAIFYLFFLFSRNEANYKIFTFLILIFYEFFNRLGSSILLTFEGLQLVTIQNLTVGMTKLIRIIGLIFSILWMRNLLGLSISYFLEGFSLFIIIIFISKKYFFSPFNQKLFKEYFYYSLPFFVIYPFTYIQGNLDMVILKNFWNSATVGYYSAAIGLTAFLKTLYGVLITLFFPRVSQLFAKNELNKIQQYTDLAIKYLLLTFTPILLSLYFFSKEFTTFVLGKEFGPSINIFSLSLAGIVILMISSPYDHVLYAAGKHQIIAPLTVLSVGLAGIFQLIFVPKNLFGINLFGLGALGSVLANLLAWFSAALVKIYLVYYYLKIKPYLKSFYIIILTLFIIILFPQDQIFLVKSLYLMLTLTTFYIIMKKIRIIQSADIKYLRLVFSPIKIIQQIREDLKDGG